MMKHIIFALAGMAMPYVAGAQMPVPPMGGGFGGGVMAADADRDGVVTRKEYMADVTRRFDQMDADHDGRVTAKEREAYREAMRDRRVADGAPGGTPPRDGHGPHRWGGSDAGAGGPGGGRELTRADYLARAGERFDRMDANHDGRIDRTDLDTMREQRRERRDGDAPPPPPPASPAAAGTMR